MSAVYEVGPGKTYDSVTGITSALNAMIAATGGDLAGQGIQTIRIYKGYNYLAPVSNIFSFINASPTDRIVVECAPEDYHNGVFGSGVILELNDANRPFEGFFDVRTDYMTFEGFEIVDYAEAASRPIRCFDDSIELVIRNCLNRQEFLTDGNPLSGILFAGGTGNAKVYNCIGVRTAAGSVSSTSLFIAGGINYTIEVYNCLTYNISRAFLNIYNGAMYNCGAIWTLGGGEKNMFINTPPITKNCFANTGAAVGDNYETYTLTECAFYDHPNYDFRILPQSVLINSGFNTLADNPQSITLQDFKYANRSPFNGLLLTNIFFHDIILQEVAPYWMNDLVLADNMGGAATPIFGSFSSRAKEPNYLTTNLGTYIRASSGVGYTGLKYTTSDLNTKKFMTFMFMFRNYTTASGPFLGATGFGMKITAGATLNFNQGTYNAEQVIPATIDPTEWACSILRVDLTQTTDSAAVRWFLSQKSTVIELALTYSGTRPTQLNQLGGEITLFEVANMDFTRMALWSRALTDHEIGDLLIDPTMIYKRKDPTEYLILSGSIGAAGSIFGESLFSGALNGGLVLQGV